MKKGICILLALMMVLALAACGGEASSSGGAGAAGSGAASAAASAPAEAAGQDGGIEGAEIAQIIVKGGTIDDNSFNQGAWEGVQKYATENGISCKYYQAQEDTIDGYVNAIDLAIRGGAKIVVTPGYVFEPAIFIAQDSYPDTKFILLDGTPQDGTYTDYRIEENVASVFYAEQQAGFLAGYASVMDGYRSLGFMGGMAVPAVVRFGYGFIQGAEAAGQELGLAAGDIDVKYTYVGNYDASPENQAKAAGWYQSGTELIFSCGGPVGFSVMAAADVGGNKVIGVDSDQSADSPTVITSAVKMLGNSVYQILDMYYGGEFPGGVSTILDVTNDGVALPMETSRFESFSQADYDALYKRLVEDEDGIASGILSDVDVDAADAIPTEIVLVQIIS